VSPQDQHDAAVVLCKRIARNIHRGGGEEQSDHVTLVAAASLTRSVLGHRRARLSECSPWSGGVRVTYGELYPKASRLRLIAAGRVKIISRPVPTFLTTLSAAAIVFLVAAHAASHAAAAYAQFVVTA